jgi:hypothetical protein
MPETIELGYGQSRYRKGMDTTAGEKERGADG